MTKAPCPTERQRYITPRIHAYWRNLVANANEIRGLHGFTREVSDEEYLSAHGLYLQDRDFRLCSDHPGRFQVAEFYMGDLHSSRENQTIRSIVGDCQERLADRAVRELIYDERGNYEAVEVANRTDS